MQINDVSSLPGANWRGINVKVTMLLRITYGVVSTSNERHLALLVFSCFQ